MTKITKVLAHKLIPFNNNGCRLMMKKTYQVSALTPKDLLPSGCTAIDFVRAETHFGKGNFNIITFKNIDGDPIKRIITKFLNGKEAEKTVKTFHKEDNVLFILSKHFRNKKNILNQTEGIYLHTIGGKKGMTRMKLNMKPLPDNSRLEEQVYEELMPKTKGIFLKTTAKRTADGAVIDKTITASNEYIIETLNKDPYLYIRNYDKKDFAKSASLHAAQRQGVEYSEKSVIDKELDGCQGFFKSATKEIFIDSSQGDKIEIINTLNHEFRHKKQQGLVTKLQMSLLNIFRKPQDKILLNTEEKDMAKKFWLAFMEYPSLNTTGKRYRNNLLEIDARAAGTAAKDEYRFWSDKLAQIFGIPKQMVFNCTLEDKIRDILDKVTRLRKLHIIEFPPETTIKS